MIKRLPSLSHIALASVAGASLFAAVCRELEVADATLAAFASLTLTVSLLARRTRVQAPLLAGSALLTGVTFHLRDVGVSGTELLAVFVVFTLGAASFAPAAERPLAAVGFESFSRPSERPLREAPHVRLALGCLLGLALTAVAPETFRAASIVAASGLVLLQELAERTLWKNTATIALILLVASAVAIG